MPRGGQDPRLVMPVEVSGTGEAVGCSGDEAIDDLNVNGYRNLVCTVDFRMSDARIPGTGQRVLKEDGYVDEAGNDYPVITGARALIVENENGARRRPVFWFETDWGAEQMTEDIELDGEGDYLGLVALLEVTMIDNQPWQYHGFIFDGDLPGRRRSRRPES